MASILQEEQEFQEELDAADIDTYREMVKGDTDDFIAGSPMRSRRRERAGSPGASQRASASPRHDGGERYERRGSASPREQIRRPVKKAPSRSSSSSSSGKKKKEEKKQNEDEEGGVGVLNAVSEVIEENKAAFAEKEKRLASVEEGSRVRRNDEFWQWGDQDGGVDNFGTVQRVDTTMRWITVRWDAVDGKKGKKNNYRWGQDKGGVTYWDVEPAPNAPPAVE